ncbi:MAG: YitT family protein [Clostridia bacterium]|nr:YitT family protein [Clostridia bacterium]
MPKHKARFPSKARLFSALRNALMLTVAGVVNAFGVTMFLAPVKLYDSGISGTSMLISQCTPQWLSLSLMLILLNVPLFMYGYKRQSRRFTVCSIYTVAIYSLTAWLIVDVLPVNVDFASPLAGTDLLLCALFGGMISGLGSGLAIRFGGAMDGIEVMAVIFAKQLGISVGMFVMIYNVALYVLCGIILQSWILPLYSILTYYVALKTVDFIVEGIDRDKSMMIVTSKPNEVCAALTKVFESGMTRVDGMGGYSNTPRTVVFFVVNRFQIVKAKTLIHNIDAGAFITISEVADVFRANQ